MFNDEWYIFIAKPDMIHQAEQLKAQVGRNTVCSVYLVDYAELLRVMNYHQRQNMIRLLNQNEDVFAKTLIQQVIDDAVCQKASDIHLDRSQNKSSIRLRIDGHLHTHYECSNTLLNNAISAIKLSANLDITEQRRPQDGRITSFTSWQQKQFFRISTCPGIHGEKMVMRLINHQNKIHNFNQLGLNLNQIKMIKKNLDRQSGLILLCGPTGSGKSMTLYTMLQYLNRGYLNVMCAEDPIEIPINGIHQVASNHQINLDFATLLRSFLRQDPDIIMLGEMRDMETADIAIKAAQTGHLVLSTLHCERATSAYQRLSNMGIPSHQLECIQLIIAQRLIRRLCQYCKRPMKDQDKASLVPKKQQLYQSNPEGCLQCNEGYQGRVGIFECHQPNNHEKAIKLSDQAWQVFLDGQCDLKTIQGYIDEK
jgi:type IV pilus assembly protein PilB